MTTKRSPVRDVDLANVGPALRRAADKARRLAVQTGTPFYVWKSGRVMDLNKSGTAYAVREQKTRYRNKGRPSKKG